MVILALWQGKRLRKKKAQLLLSRMLRKIKIIIIKII